MKALLITLLITLFVPVSKVEITGPSHLWGAWEYETTVDGKQVKTVKIYTRSYFITSTYADMEYISASGGTWDMGPDMIEETYEFHTVDPDLVGTTIKAKWTDHEEGLQTEMGGEMIEWKRLDNGQSELAGAWRFTGRERNGEITRSMELRPRRTFKILSGTRFQWAAYNVATKEFFGTGGGTYTLKDGKYTEQIEVFSRDNSRVGASLEFNYEVKEKDWHHSGLNSRGEPMYEIWTNSDQD